MSRVRVIALGSRTACDDEAALLAAERLGEMLDDSAHIIMAGRPGPGLVDLLDADTPTVILDVISAGLAPAQVLSIPLDELTEATVAGRPLSSHGFGPAEALRLAQNLGRPLPPGVFVGIQGCRLTPGMGIDPMVAENITDLVEAAAAAARRLCSPPSRTDPCTSPA